MSSEQSPPAFVEMLPHELAMDAHGVFFAVYPLRLVRGCVRKRYRNFQDLDVRLRALPAAHRPQRKDLPVLTSKRWGAGLRDDVIDKRRRKLSEYLQELSSLADRVSDLEAQLAEHALVAKTMRPMEKGRRASWERSR